MKKNNLAAPPRQRTSVPIQGLDLITPDDTVADGKCQILHNMRYEGGAWRPTHPYTTNLNANIEIIYNHNFDGTDHYIYYNGDTGCFVSASKSATPKQSIISLPKDTKISHFGKVLIFTTDSTVYYFLHVDDSYCKWSIPDYIRTSVKKYDYKQCEPSAGVTSNETGEWVEYNNGWGRNANGDTAAGMTGYARWYPFYNITQGYSMLETGLTDYWHGELLLFCTFVMTDGTNISPSPLHLLKSNSAYSEIKNVSRDICNSKSPVWLFRDTVTSSDNEEEQDTYLAIRVISNDGQTTVPDSEPLLQSCTASLQLSFSLSDEQRQMIKSIAIWSTRLNPILTNNPQFTYQEAIIDSSDDRSGGWDVPLSGQQRENLGGDRGYRSTTRSESNFRQGTISSAVVPSNAFTAYYANNDLANQPFYLMSEIPIDSISGSSYLLNITKELLDQCVGNRVYEPSNNVHNIIPRHSFDYNARLHLVAPTTTLSLGYNFGDIFPKESQTELVGVNTSLKTSNHTYTFGAQHFVGDKLSSKLDNVPFSHIISYPDYRATIIHKQGVTPYVLKPAVGNNFAWYHQPHTFYEKFPLISDALGLESFTLRATDRVVVESNKIQVSAPNNCFNLPYGNSYTIGSSSNKIIAINSPAIEMHEMKIGELPLYVFTEEGIFALQAGANTLYASVVPVNHDKIINPNTLAINNALVYATERGIHMLRGSENVIISTPIHKNGIVPIDVFKTCTFINPKAYNELVVLRSDGSGAYIYNLDSGYWSTRELSGWKLNTDELVTRNSGYFTIYNLTNEVEDECQTPQIITRPIKLGTLEYKRVETMIPRIQRNPETTYGFKCQLLDKWNQGKGNQMGEYTLDQSGLLPIGIRRTGSSSQYFTFRFVSTDYYVNIGPDFSISHIDFEWYERFRRRMR